MRRVLVIGIPGAGKSTFARVLAARTGLPLIHLDREFWQPGWQVTPREEWRGKVAVLVAREAWVMDGNYDSSLDMRLPRADTVMWFDYPRRVALPRVAKTYGHVREDLAPGCPEKIDLEFLRYIWEFPARERPRVVASLAQHGRHLRPIVFQRDRDVARFLDGLPAT